MTGDQMRKIMRLVEGSVVSLGGKAPDVGTTFTYQGREYRVTGWAKEMPSPKRLPFPGASDPVALRQWLDQTKSSGLADVLGDVLASSQRTHTVGGRELKLVCGPEDAEFVNGSGVAGVTAPISDITITGRVPWSESDIAEERQIAMSLIGQPV